MHTNLCDLSLKLLTNKYGKIYDYILIHVRGNIYAVIGVYRDFII